MRKESIRNVRGRRACATSGGARRLARQTAKKAVEGEIKGALGMSKVGFAALQDDADDGSIQRCQHLRPITLPELAGVFVQGDISPVMQSILDAPLLACNLAQSLGACYTCRQTRNPIAFLIWLRDREAKLGPGELFVVPRGVEHQPFAEAEVHLLLIEPAGTPNTGDAATATPRLVI